VTLQKVDALLEGRVHRVVATGLDATQAHQWTRAIRCVAVSPVKPEGRLSYLKLT